jgi:hypothetical protein
LSTTTLTANFDEFEAQLFKEWAFAGIVLSLQLQKAQQKPLLRD